MGNFLITEMTIGFSRIELHGVGYVVTHTLAILLLQLLNQFP